MNFNPLKIWKESFCMIPNTVRNGNEMKHSGQKKTNEVDTVEINKAVTFKDLKKIRGRHKVIKLTVRNT